MRCEVWLDILKKTLFMAIEKTLANTNTSVILEFLLATRTKGTNWRKMLGRIDIEFALFSD